MDKDNDSRSAAKFQRLISAQAESALTPMNSSNPIAIPVDTESRMNLADIIYPYQNDIEVILSKRNEEKLESFIPTTDFKFDHPEAFSDWLVAVANDDRYIKEKQLIDKQNEKGGHINMCVLLDMYEERGEARGIHEINTLNLRLLDDNRLEDMQRAMVDTDYQKELMKEYGFGV